MSHNSHDFDEIQLYMHIMENVMIVYTWFDVSILPHHIHNPPPLSSEDLNLLHSLRKFTEKDFAPKTNVKVILKNILPRNFFLDPLLDPR